MDKRQYLEKHLAHFEIDVKDVGMYIAEGGQHMVFHYKNNQVIKVPKNNLLMKLYGMYKCRTMIKSNDLVNEKFGKYALKSIVIPSKNHRTYVVIQEFLENGKIITLNNFEKVKLQFEEIAMINQEIRKENNKSLDFISFYGFFKTIYGTISKKKQYTVIENILVLRNGTKYELKIIDFNLFEIRLFNTRINPIHWAVDQFFYRGSKLLIKHNFHTVI